MIPLRVLGAGNRARTGDLDLGKVALYQLSYTRDTANYGDQFYCVNSCFLLHALCMVRCVMVVIV